MSRGSYPLIIDGVQTAINLSSIEFDHVEISNPLFAFVTLPSLPRCTDLGDVLLSSLRSSVSHIYTSSQPIDMLLREFTPIHWVIKMA